MFRFHWYLIGYSLKLYGHIPLLLGHNSETALRRVKQTKIWASGIYDVCTWVLLTPKLPMSSIWRFSVQFSPNWVILQKRLIVESNECKLNWPAGTYDVIGHLNGYLWPLKLSRSFWRFSLYFSPNWALPQKWLLVDLNRQKLSMHVDIFDLEYFKVILGSFGSPFSKLVQLKLAHHRVKLMKIWASWAYQSCVGELLTLNMLWGIRGHLVHFCVNHPLSFIWWINIILAYMC